MRVVNEKAGVRHAHCGGCGNTLEYEREDVKYESGWNGMGDNDDPFYYVICMVCKQWVHVAKWE